MRSNGLLRHAWILIISLQLKLYLYSVCYSQDCLQASSNILVWVETRSFSPSLSLFSSYSSLMNWSQRAPRLHSWKATCSCTIQAGSGNIFYFFSFLIRGQNWHAQSSWSTAASYKTVLDLHMTRGACLHLVPSGTAPDSWCRSSSLLLALSMSHYSLPLLFFYPNLSPPTHSEVKEYPRSASPAIVGIGMTMNCGERPDCVGQLHTFFQEYWGRFLFDFTFIPLRIILQRE